MSCQPITGTCVLLDVANIDTDQIMPKQFCLRTDRAGYEDALFFEWRRAGHSALNAPRARTSPLLVAGPNFGCGSSREHAVWGLLDFGFRAVIAPGFGDTFGANAAAAGLVVASIAADDYRALCTKLRADPATPLSLDVAKQQLVAGAGAHRHVHAVAIPAFHRYLHLGGYTEVGLAASHADAVRRHEAKRPRWMPRVAPA